MYKYCPKCGGDLISEKANPINAYVCQRCSYRFYQNSKPTVSAIIFNNLNQILLVKRAINPSLNKWDIPGGFLNNGEEPIVGLKREMKEELGIEINPKSLVGIYIDKYYDQLGEFDFTFNLYYQAKISKDKIILNEENLEFKWFDKKNIPWGNLAFEQINSALKDYYNSKSFLIK